MAQSKISIDDILQSTAIGSIDKAVGNNLYGFNHNQTSSAIPANREQQGFVFFVRPQLNLQHDNIANSRKFMPLASDVSDTTIHRFVRTTLDPRLMTGYKFGNNVIPPIESPLTNNAMAFIPVLTNNALTVSGWPDPVVPIWESKAGRYNESYAQVDGMVENFSQFTIDVTFRNTIADPILYMFYIWTLYTQYVFSGKFVPYPDFITDNRMDYNTRIYRVRLDRNRQKVTKIISTGPAIPVASSVGQFGDMNFEEVLSLSTKDIAIRFQCGGIEIFDDILVFEFNETVRIFQPMMGDDARDGSMVLIPRSLSHVFQHRAYPRINPSNHNMEWWVEQDLFDIRTRAFLETLNSSELIPTDSEATPVFDDFEESENQFEGNQ